jgi:hypothetical protein
LTRSVTAATQVNVRTGLWNGSGREVRGTREGDVLADPDVGEPQRLGLEGEATDQRGSGALAGVGEVDAVVH